MNIGIIGYGKMGSSIFKLLAAKPYQTTVFARTEQKAKSNEEKFFRGLQRAVKRGRLTEEEFTRKQETLKFTHRLEDLKAGDIVIETIVESYKQKVEILRAMEAILHRDGVLVTNTSSISIESLAKELSYRDRFCGLHFFHPIMLIDLVEIIKWSNTPAELVGFLKDFCGRIDKTPIVVLDSPGSAINAILAYYYVEALYILEDGIALPSKIDRLAKKFFYVGPCESMDVIGIDFFVEALQRAANPGSLLPILWTGNSQAELPNTVTGGREGFRLPHLFGKLISENRLGKKTSRGIYLYEGEKPRDDVSEFYKSHALLSASENISNIEEYVAKRLLYSVFKGCAYSLEKGVSSREELDLGVKEILHMTEGPFTMMRHIGKQKLEEEFDFLASNVGERFRQTTFDFLGE